MANNRVIIVGAGVGGLTAAVDLANKGFEVTLLEKAARPGGKMREIAIGNHRLDAGPTVFTLRRVFDELFDACGTSLESHVELEPLDLLARHAWDEEAHLDLYADLDRSADAIAKFAGADEARRYRARARHR